MHKLSKEFEDRMKAESECTIEVKDEKQKSLQKKLKKQLKKSLEGGK